MSISLSILLYIYLALVAVFIIFSIFNIYHLLRFAKSSAINISIIIFYIIISLIILFVSWQYISQIDWQISVELFLSQPNKLIL